MDYLEYAYLQTAQDEAARRVADEIARGSKAEPASHAAAYAIAAVPARFALERHDWRQAANLSLPTIPFPWERFPWTPAMIAFTRALGAARTGDVATAKEEIAKLEAVRAKLVDAKNTYWADQVEVERQAATGILAHVQGADGAAITTLRSAAELESSMEKSSVTPGAVLPARELLADVLLETGQPADALREYQATLASEPERFRSVFGAAQAAEQLGDLAKARDYYENAARLMAGADTRRPEQQVTEAFLTKR